MIDGLLILLAGLLLVTPGFLTDIFGFLCLTQAFRSYLKAHILRKFQTTLTSQNPQEVIFHSDLGRESPPDFQDGPIIDIHPEGDAAPKDKGPADP